MLMIMMMMIIIIIIIIIITVIYEDCTFKHVRVLVLRNRFVLVATVKYKNCRLLRYNAVQLVASVSKMRKKKPPPKC